MPRQSSPQGITVTQPRFGIPGSTRATSRRSAGYLNPRPGLLFQLRCRLADHYLDLHMVLHFTFAIIHPKPASVQFKITDQRHPVRPQCDGGWNFDVLADTEQGEFSGNFVLTCFAGQPGFF